MKSLVFVLSLPLILSQAASASGCTIRPSNKELRKAGFLVKAKTVTEYEGATTEACKVIVTNASGEVLARIEALEVDLVEVRDINNDGSPDLLFENHCIGNKCFYNEVVTRNLVPHSAILWPAFAVLPSPKDNSEVLWVDQVLTGFDGLGEAGSPISHRAIKMKGWQVQDVSKDFQKQFDEEIRLIKGRLDKEQNGQQRTEHIYSIVFDLLYSGRQKEADEFLENNWSPNDLARVKALIAARLQQELARPIVQPQKLLPPWMKNFPT